MNKAIQAKHLNEIAILRVLARSPGKWHTHHFNGGDSASMPQVVDPTTKDAPQKVLVAKLAALKRRGLIDGCPCGCRGDWHITERGLLYLESLS